MTKQEYLDLLLQGVEQWNEWVQENPHVRPDLSGVDLTEANLIGASLLWSDLSSANLSRADLSRANLIGANLKEAKLGTLTNADLEHADLERADLSHATASGACFSLTNLCGATLCGTTLAGTDLSGANLSEADLSKADLSLADLREANLSRANLSGADLHGADLSGAELDGANLSKTQVSSTIFAKIDLRTTRGLIEIIHQMPSVVQLHTIQLPQDGSALHFLRGVGIPDDWIDFYRAQMMLPIQYHLVFISYSHRDEMLARRLHADLQDRGVRCWFAPEDLKIGDKIRDRINREIHIREKVLLLLSKCALESSWVEDEVEAALEREHRQQLEVLFPVRLDESVMQAPQAWAAKVRRTRHIGDFTRWTDPQEYQKAFARLLRDLKAEAGKEHGNHLNE